MRRAVAAVFGVLGASVAASSSVGAQSLSGRVTRGGTGVEGAIVLLVDQRGVIQARAIARDGGRYTVVAAPGTYGVRALRIGFAPTAAGPFVLQSGVTTRADIDLTGAPVRLAEITVIASSECRVRPDSAAVAFRVWEEARKALLAASLTKSEALSMVVSRTDRTLDRAGSRVLAETSSTAAGRTVNPFVSLSPDSAARYGFVTRSSDGRTYWGPDAEILLSEPFAATHCLRLRGESAPASKLIGVGFAPAARQGDVVEVEGVVWVDRQTAELRALDYQYVNLPIAERARAGGHVDFLRLPSGLWVAERWAIRYPQVSVRSNARRGPVIPGVSRSPEPREELSGIRVASGEISEVRRGSTVLWERGRVSLRVRVVDEASQKPMAGVLVGDTEGAGAVATDQEGVVRLDRVRRGALTLRLRAPEVETFGEESTLIPVTVGMSNDTVLTVALPSARQLLVARCGMHSLQWGEGLVRGQLAGGRAAAGERVFVRWRTAYRRLGGGTPTVVESSREVVADSAGQFTVCGVPRDAEITIERAGASPTAPLHFAPRALALFWRP